MASSKKSARKAALPARSPTEAARAVIYCRVSSDLQRENNTIESQRDVLCGYARAQGWTLVAIDEDDGLTGEIDPWERPGMGRTLARIEEGEVDVLLVIDVDRIARDEDNIAFGMVRKHLRDAGVRLYTPRGELDLESPEQRLFQDVLSALASFERHKIKDRTVRGRKASIRKGGRPIVEPPLGYRWSNEAGGVVVDEEEAEAVRAVYRLLAEGRGATATASELKRRGIRTGRSKYDGKNRYYTDPQVRITATRTCYATGSWTPHPEWLPDHSLPVPPLVDAETWDAAQRSLSQGKVFPAREVTFPYLLRGLARCGQCGGAMRCHTSSQRQGGKPYYRCDRAARTPINHERCPGPASVRAEAVDAAVWAYVERLLSDPNTLRAEVERLILAESAGGVSVEDGLLAVARELAALDDARARAVRAMVRGALTEDEFDAEAAELDRQRVPLLQRRELLLLRQQGEGERRARLAAIEQRLAALRTALPNLSPEGRIALVRALMERVTLDTARREVRIESILIDIPEPPPTDQQPPGGGGEGRGVGLARTGGTRRKRRGSGVSGRYGSDAISITCATQGVTKVFVDDCHPCRLPVSPPIYNLSLILSSITLTR